MSDSTEVYYVVLRGAGRQALFRDDEDRLHFTHAVSEAATACGITVHAYCWLQSEARLAVKAAQTPISQFAQYIAEKHATRLKQRISLTDSPFEQQYRGVPVDGQTELPELVRHIHLAPLKAGLADDLADYPWSSHLVYAGLESAPWITTAETLRHFEEAGVDPRRGYIEFMTRGARQLDTQPSPSAVQDADDPGGDLRKK
jgi:putative transposase